MNTAGRGAVSSAVSRTSLTMPTISQATGGPLERRMRWPIGFSLNQNRRTRLSLMRAAGVERLVSSAVNSRPRASAIPMARKYPGVATLSMTVGSELDAVGRPSSDRDVSVLSNASLNGTVDTAPAAITPGTLSIR